MNRNTFIIVCFDTYWASAQMIISDSKNCIVLMVQICLQITGSVGVHWCLLRSDGVLGFDRKQNVSETER